jgi:hypothetical protein
MVYVHLVVVTIIMDYIRRIHMSEWLTTGQMLDVLRVGEIAEGSTHWEVRKLDDGSVVELNSGNQFKLDIGFLNESWRIIPKYVSFEDAMKALEAGKKVSFYDHQWQTTFDKYDYLENKQLGGYAFKDLFQGTWVIEN